MLKQPLRLKCWKCNEQDKKSFMFRQPSKIDDKTGRLTVSFKCSHCGNIITAFHEK